MRQSLAVPLIHTPFYQKIRQRLAYHGSQPEEELACLPCSSRVCSSRVCSNKRSQTSCARNKTLLKRIKDKLVCNFCWCLIQRDSQDSSKSNKIAAESDYSSSAFSTCKPSSSKSYGDFDSFEYDHQTQKWCKGDSQIKKWNNNENHKERWDKGDNQKQKQCKDVNQKQKCYKEDNQKQKLYKDDNQKQKLYKDDNQKQKCYKNDNQKQKLYKEDNQKQKLYKDDNQKQKCYKDDSQKQKFFKDDNQEQKLYKDDKHYNDNGKRSAQFDLVQFKHTVPDSELKRSKLKSPCSPSKSHDEKKSVNNKSNKITKENLADGRSIEQDKSLKYVYDLTPDEVTYLKETGFVKMKVKVQQGMSIDNLKVIMHKNKRKQSNGNSKCRKT